MNLRQSVVVRRDLNLTPGLLAAQVAHISAQMFFEKIRDCVKFSNTELEWIREPVISILAVNNFDELRILEDMAVKIGVSYMEWTDTIPSQIFAGRFLEVVVGASFGPDNDEKIKQVTGTLPLY